MGRAIEIDGVGKRYRLGEGFHKYRTLRDALTSAFTNRGDEADRELWALSDIDLAVDEGDIVGVVGRNGAGKTTLLKIVARITEPTVGVCRTRGRVAALLEVGTGFHPELTGRENIYLNGAILGMSRRYVRRRFADIVEFAGLERFLDTPLKRYSVGMYLRLAFAVAAHVEPEIVVVDEVLAVGDAEFRRRCLGKMSEFGREGRTVLFVSHDLGAIAQACPRSIWLDGGRIRADGPTAASLELYLKEHVRGELRSEYPPDPNIPADVVSVAITDARGNVLESPRRDMPLWVQVRFRLRETIPNLDIGIYVVGRQGVRIIEEYWSDTHADDLSASEPGEYDVAVGIPAVLAPGDYTVGVWLGTAYEEFVDREALTFALVPSPEDRQEVNARARLLQPSLDWRADTTTLTAR